MEAAYPETEGGRRSFDTGIGEGLLEELAGRSERLTEGLLERLGGEPPTEVRSDEEISDREELEAATFAAAAVDATVGADVLIAFEEEAGDPLDSELEAVLRRAVPPAGEMPPIGLLLARADATFGKGQAIAGASPGDPWAITRAGDAVDELVGAAGPRVFAFGKSMLTGGAAGVAGAAGGFDAIHEFVERAAGRVRSGARLLQSALKKLAATVGSESILEWIGEQILDRIIGVFDGRTEPLNQRAVRKVARADASVGRVALMVSAAAGEVPSSTSKLDADLNRLCSRFGKNMWWAEVAQKQIARCSLIVAIVGAGLAGQVALAAVNWVGLVTCLFALCDRLDTVPGGVGWAKGVPTLVRES